ncbi:hypothetical protein EOM89_11310, partial [Candidatus Falkowbacteria bacterium]|nr:hypothetical protein [Candidatus Falkowbacteria bacterium]
PMHKPGTTIGFCALGGMMSFLSPGATAFALQHGMKYHYSEVVDLTRKMRTVMNAVCTPVGGIDPARKSLYSRLQEKYNLKLSVNPMIQFGGRWYAYSHQPQAPMFTHQVAWRALIPAEPGARPVAQVFVAPGRHLVSYPLQGGLRNIVAVEERRRWVEESWSLRDDPRALRAAFEGFCPQVQGWLAQVEQPWLWGLFRHAVAARWQGDGAVILGDAAHPTLPFLAQGAVMAIEDAWVLAESLARHDSDTAALAAYQAARAPRCRQIVEAANRNARNYHLSGAARVVAHLGLRGLGLVAPGRLLAQYDWVYDHDVTGGAGTA